MVIRFLGTFDHGYGRYACGLGFPCWKCLEWVLWDHHCVHIAVVRLKVSIIDGDWQMLIGSTVQFVGITAFHTQIADPLIGGTYMTVS